MQKFGLFIIAGVFLTACSFSNLIPGIANPVVNTFTPNPTVTHTSSPTPTVTLTPRDTPTDIGHFLTQTAEAPITPIPGVRTATPWPSPTPLPPPTSSSPGEGFDKVTVSEKKLYWGICKPNTATMTVTVLHPEQVRTVYLFFRLKSFKKEDYTLWVGTVTDDKRNGTYTYLLRANIIPNRKSYTKAWIQYQFVAEDKNEKIVGRTHIYEQNLSLQPCP